MTPAAGAVRSEDDTIDEMDGSRGMDKPWVIGLLVALVATACGGGLEPGATDALEVSVQVRPSPVLPEATKTPTGTTPVAPEDIDYELVEEERCVGLAVSIGGEVVDRYPCWPPGAIRQYNPCLVLGSIKDVDPGCEPGLPSFLLGRFDGHPTIVCLPSGTAETRFGPIEVLEISAGEAFLISHENTIIEPVAFLPDGRRANLDDHHSEELVAACRAAGDIPEPDIRHVLVYIRSEAEAMVFIGNGVNEGTGYPPEFFLETSGNVSGDFIEVTSSATGIAVSGTDLGVYVEPHLLVPFPDEFLPELAQPHECRDPIPLLLTLGPDAAVDPNQIALTLVPPGVTSESYDHIVSSRAPGEPCPDSAPIVTPDDALTVGVRVRFENVNEALITRQTEEVTLWTGNGGPDTLGKEVNYKWFTADPDLWSVQCRVLGPGFIVSVGEDPDDIEVPSNPEYLLASREVPWPPPNPASELVVTIQGETFGLLGRPDRPKAEFTWQPAPGTCD